MGGEPLTHACSFKSTFTFEFSTSKFEFFTILMTLKVT